MKSEYKPETEEQILGYLIEECVELSTFILVLSF